MTISEPEAFEPGEYAFMAEDGGEAALFTVTVDNGTGESFDPSIIYITASSAGQEAQEIYDQNLGGSPQTTVPDGRSVEYQVGFSVADPSDIIMDVSPSFEYEAATFTH